MILSKKRISYLVFFGGDSFHKWLHSTLHKPPKPAWRWRSPPSLQLRGRPSPKATAPTRPALFSAGCGPGTTSCQSAGSTVVTSPPALAHHHPVNATTAAARLGEFTLEEDKKGGVSRGDTWWFDWPSCFWKRKMNRRVISSRNYSGHGNQRHCCEQTPTR